MDRRRGSSKTACAFTKGTGRRCSGTVLLALGLIPLALGVIESFTFALRLPNHLAAVFPGRESLFFFLA